MEEAAPVIRLENLSKSFGDLQVVRNLSLAVPRGEVFGFLGPNGAGKSTTIRMMLSLIRPTEGRVRLFGFDLKTEREKALRRIGCIVEKPDFYKYLSAEKNLDIFGRLSGIKPTRKRIYELLEMVGLKGREKAAVGTYSHGMKQRLGLAQTLLHDPDLIILDEPTTGLDPQGIIDIRNLILQLQKEHGKTVFLSSHLLNEVELTCSSMAILHNGELRAQGKVQELLSHGNLIVTIRTPEAEHATGLLSASAQWKAGKPHSSGGELRLETSRENIPALSRFLCENDIPIYELMPRRTLEDYFLKLTAAE